MKWSHQVYSKLLGIFCLSAGIVIFLALTGHDVIAGLVAAPGITALSNAVFQLMKDAANYERQKETQHREFQFTLGATTHMANVIFDKHAEFCTKYMQTVNEIVRTLFQTGQGSQENIYQAGTLYTIRQEYVMWLTNQIDTDLKLFEDTLRKLGAQAEFIKTTAKNPAYAEQQLIFIKENSELFMRILGLNLSVDGTPEESMSAALNARLRTVLGVQDLTKIREHLIKQASSAIQPSTSPSSGAGGTTSPF